MKVKATPTCTSNLSPQFFLHLTMRTFQREFNCGVFEPDWGHWGFYNISWINSIYLFQNTGPRCKSILSYLSIGDSPMNKNSRNDCTGNLTKSLVTETVHSLRCCNSHVFRISPRNWGNDPRSSRRRRQKSFSIENVFSCVPCISSYLQETYLWKYRH